jgi:hypothetical protein
MLCKGRSTHHKEIIGDCYEADKFNNATHLAPLLQPLAILCYIHWPCWELWNHMAVHAEDTVIELLNMAIEIIDLPSLPMKNGDLPWFSVSLPRSIHPCVAHRLQVLPRFLRFSQAPARHSAAEIGLSGNRYPAGDRLYHPFLVIWGCFTHTHIYIGLKHIYIYIIGSGDVI